MQSVPEEEAAQVSRPIDEIDRMDDLGVDRDAHDEPLRSSAVSVLPAATSACEGGGPSATVRSVISAVMASGAQPARACATANAIA